MVVAGLGNIWLENLLDNQRFNMGLTDLGLVRKFYIYTFSQKLFELFSRLFELVLFVV